MASRFWVGGTANWDATAGSKWATTSGGAGGAAVPTAADDVFFDSASGVGVVVTIPSATTVVCRSIDCTGYTRTLAFAATTSALTVGDGSGGAVKFVSGMTLTLTGIGTINFVSTSTNGGTGWGFTTGGKTVPNLTFSGTGGKWVWQDNVTATGATVTHTAGELDTNGKTWSCAAFSCTGATTRVLTLGASAVSCTGGWTVTGSNVTLNAGTSSITMTSTAQFAGLNLSWYDLTFTTAGQAILTGTAGGISFHNLTRTGTAVKTDRFSLLISVTVTNNFTVNGNSATNRLLVDCGATIGSTRTIACNGTVTASNVDFQDIAAVPTSLTLPGTSGNYISAPDSSALSVTGDIDVRVRADLSWATGPYTLVAKSDTTGNQRSWRFETDGSGRLQFVASSDGTTTTTVTSSVASSYVSTTLAGWARVTWRQSDGRTQFFTSLNGVTWTQLGTDVTTSVASLFDSTAAVEIGSCDAGTSQLWAGSVYYAEVRNGIGGTVVGKFDASAVTVLGTRNPTTYSDGTNTWTANGSTWDWTTKANWNLSAITGKSGDCQGNSGITFTTPATQTFTSGTKNWSDATVWTSRVPLPQDDVIVNTTTATTLTGDMPRLGHSINFTSFTRTFSRSVATTIYGDLTLASGMTWTASSFNVTLAGRGTQTLTSNGITIGVGSTSSSLNFHAIIGKYTLQDDLTVTSSTSGQGVALLSGELDQNGHDVYLSGNGPTQFISTTTTWARTLTPNGGRFITSGTNTTAGNKWSVVATNLTFTTPPNFTVGVANASASTFQGGGMAYGTLDYTLAGSTGGLIITGANTFDAIKFSDASNARTLTLPASTITTVTSASGWQVNGTAGKLMSVVSSTAGTQAILVVAPGGVSSDYLSLKDIYATGTAPVAGAGFVQRLGHNHAASSTTTVVTLDATPASGSTVIVGIATADSSNISVSSVADSRGNTYVLDRNSGAGGTTRARATIAHTTQDVAPLQSGDTVTVTQSATNANNSAAAVYEYAGLTAFTSPSVVDGAASVNSGASGASLTIPAATTAQPVDVLISLLTLGNSQTLGQFTPPTGYTIRDTGENGQVYSFELADVIATTAGVQPATTWSWVSSLLMSGLTQSYRLMTTTVFYAGANSTNVSGNADWTFTAPVFLPSGVDSAEAFGSPTITVSSSGQTVSPDAIGTAEAEGSPTVSSAITLTLTGLASLETFGTTQLNLTSYATGVASGEAEGTPTLTPGQVNVLPTGVASDEAEGTPTVTPGVVVLSPTGIATAEAVGGPTLTPGATTVAPTGLDDADAPGTPTVSTLSTIAPAGIATGEVVDSLSVTLGSATLLPDGIATAEGFGTPTLSTAVTVLITAIASEETFGTPDVPTHTTVTVTAIDTGETFGAPTLLSLDQVYPTAVDSAETFGTPVLTTTVTVTPVGLATDEAVGTPTLNTSVTVSVTGIAGADATGTPSLHATYTIVADQAIPTQEAFGTPQLSAGPVTVPVDDAASAEAFGAPTLTAGAVAINATGIPSGEASGQPAVSSLAHVAPAGIVDAAAVGTPTITTTVTVYPDDILTGEGPGSPAIQPGLVDVTVTGLASQEAVPSPTLLASITLLAAGILSAETVSAITLAAGGVSVHPAGIDTDEMFGAIFVARASIPAKEPTSVSIRQGLVTARIAAYVATVAIDRAISTVQVDAGE